MFIYNILYILYICIIPAYIYNNIYFIITSPIHTHISSLDKYIMH